jgi:hypothetical protein
VVGIFWAVVGGVLALMLLAAWWMDRSARRRSARIINSQDIWYEVRESRRDAEILGNPSNHDTSWSSWNRRNSRGR